MNLWLVSITIGRASEFITNHDRPHSPPAGALFALGITDGEGQLLGVAIAGRPVPPAGDDGATVEITRSLSSVDRSSHIEIALYRAVWRVARAEGYRRLITHSQVGDIRLGLREIGLRSGAGSMGLSGRSFTVVPLCEWLSMSRQAPLACSKV